MWCIEEYRFVFNGSLMKPLATFLLPYLTRTYIRYASEMRLKIVEHTLMEILTLFILYSAELQIKAVVGPFV